MKKMTSAIVRMLLVLALVAALGLGLAACGDQKAAEPTAPAAQADNTGSQDAEQLDLYWNVDYKDYSSGQFTRTFSTDGFIYMQFSKDGQQMRLPVADYFLAVKLDLWKVAGLVFDENGVVVDAKRVEDCTGGYLAKNCTVSAVDGNKITCNTSGLLDGREITFEITEDTPIYDIAGTGITVGIPKAGINIDDLVTVILNADGSIRCIYAEGYTEPMDIYWNVNRMYDSTSKITTRMSDPTGGYTFELACNGEIVTLRAKESNIAQDIDAMAAKCFGLEFDEEGYITRVIHAGTACGGGSVASWYHCMETDGQRAEFKRIASGSNVGATYSGMLATNMKVFDVSGNGAFIGEPTDLRAGDQVHCLLDSRNRVSVVFVVSRKADSPVYWNVDRKWDSAKSETTRKPNDNGVYEILVAVGGEQKYVYTTDWEIANKIDGRAAMCFGLRVDENDYIEKFYTPESVTYGTYASWYNITKLDGNDIELYKTSNGDVKIGKLAADVEIYDCSATAMYEGMKGTLDVGDTVHTLKNEQGEICVAFIITKYVRWPVYYNLDRQWDSTNECTKRTRNADGYFEFRMAVDGEEVYLKTKSYDVANAIDKEVAKCLTMSVDENGIIYKAMHAKNTVPAKGAARSSYTTVTKVSKTGFTTYKSDTGKYSNEKIAWNMKVYNVSTNVLSHQGEETTVQVGDYVHCLSNERGEITYVFVMTRPLTLPVYYNLDRKWDGSASTRQPDADGVYSFQMAYGGGEVTMYTTDPQVVYDIDKEVAMCVALRVNDEGFITYATHAKNSTYCGGGIGMSYADVTAVDGNKVTVLKDGKYTTFTVSDDCEMFVTKNIEDLTRGNYTTVRVGDYVHCLKNSDGETNYMAIMNRVKQVPTVDHECEHVTEDVTWYEWDGSGFALSGHYVLTEDITMPERVTINNGVDVTLCLNGHTVTCDDRFFSLYGNLTICDHKNGDGNYEGVMESAYSGKVYGALAYIYNNKGNANLNIYGGNFVHSGEAYNGALVFMGQGIYEEVATFNLYDGVLTGGNATGKGGAVLISNNSVFNMYGGEISGNKAAGTGGAVNCAQGQFNMYGGLITGNTSGGNGAGVDIDHSKSVFTMTGGTITGNTTTSNNGGGLNVNNGNATVTGGTIAGNKAKEGGNVRVGQSAKLTVSGAAVIKDGSATNGGNFTVIGKLTLDGVTTSGGVATGAGSEISAYSNAAAANGVVTLNNATVNGVIRLGAGEGKTELFVVNSTVTGKTLVGANDCNITVEGKVSMGEVNLADEKVIVISENGLDDTSSILVSMANPTVAFATLTDLNDAGVFKPAKTGDKVELQGNDLYLISSTPVTPTVTHKHCVCGGVVKVEEHKTCGASKSYTAWSDTTGLPSSGSYVLMDDVTMSTTITVAAGNTLNLCLNGHSITSTIRVFSVRGTLNLCDCADTQGQVIGNTSATQANGGVFYVYNNATFNLYGGTLTTNGKKVTGEGGIGCVAGGTNGLMNIYGGTVENGAATKTGGNFVLWDGATLNIHGGTIKGGSGTGGGNINIAKGTVNMTGGVIEGGSATGYGGNIRVQQGYSFIMTGGEIKGGSASSGGPSIYGNKSGTTVADIQLLGGKITAGTCATAYNAGVLSYGNVVIGGDVQIEKIYVADGVMLIESTEKPLTDKASIGVTARAACTFMENVTDLIAGIVVNQSTMSITYTDGTLTIG